MSRSFTAACARPAPLNFAGSTVEPLSVYPSLLARPHSSGGGYDLLDRGGWRALAVVDRRRTATEEELHFVTEAGATVLVLSGSREKGQPSAELRSGHGRLIGALEEDSSGLVLVRRAGQPALVTRSSPLTPGDATFERVPPRTPRRVARVQKCFDHAVAELVFESRSLDTDERALLLAALIIHARSGRPPLASQPSEGTVDPPPSRS